MGYIQGSDRRQVIMFPDCLDDYVNLNNEVRIIDAFVDSLDMGMLGFKAEPAKEGRPGYDPRDMLKLYIYGYLNQTRSSRRLQKEASRNIEVMWLLKKVVPDFRCIADFRKNNPKALKEVFKSFIVLCNKAGLLSHDSVVIDGSKFRVVNADNKSYTSGNVGKVLKDIDEKIEHYMKEMDERDKTEGKPGELSKEDIANVLEYLSRRKEQLFRAKEQMEKTGETHICTTDPECRLMKTRDGIRPSFNVQTAVESKNHIIVHYDVTND
ncbi:MAG: transposase [Selenomonadaceae bacterium]|nr:transposase [Selenomonadaceae bacterium]